MDSISWRLAQKYELVVLEEGGVLLDTRAGQYWQLNRTACEMLVHIQATGSVRALRRQLEETYPGYAVGQDLETQLAEFGKLGVIEHD